jgi:hypothetical protein
LYSHRLSLYSWKAPKLWQIFKKFASGNCARARSVYSQIVILVI